MKNQNNISPEDLFRENLNGFEVPYEEEGWQQMAALLDKNEKKRPFLWWFYKNKKNTIITLISLTMITSTIILALQLSSTSIEEKITIATEKQIQTESNIEANENALYNNKKSAVGTIQNESKVSEKSNMSDVSKHYWNNIAAKHNQNGNTIINENTTGNAEYTGTADNENPVENISVSASVTKIEFNTYADSVITPKGSTLTLSLNQNAKAAKATSNVVPKPKVTTTKDWGKNDGPFRGGWIGLHFTSQYPQTPILKDSWRQNAGFNIQFMSRNLTGRRDFSGYLGFDFGMQFTGRGQKSGIVLDNKNEDSGFTRLSNHSLDFFLRGHFEYDKFRLKPYFNAFAGPRIFATSQYTEAYHQSTEYESTNNTNAYSSASWMYGAGFGVRYRLSSVVSLDARYEWMQGTETSLVNLEKSNFNGLNYNLSKFRVKPAYTQFKVGLLFDVGSEEETKHPDETEEVTEYYQYDSATQTYTKVNCKCKQWTVSDTTSEDTIIVVKKAKPFYPYYDPNYTPGKSSGSGGSLPSNGGGSGGKGSFPGIKPGGGGIKPKS